MDLGRPNRLPQHSAEDDTRGKETAGLRLGASSSPQMTGLATSVEAASLVPADTSETPNNTTSAFRALPHSVIEHILYLADPNTFSSLVFLNRIWHNVSQQAELYKYQLSRCARISTDESEASELNGTELDANDLAACNNNLLLLRQKFALETKRNLFAAYGITRKTTINLIPPSASSSVATPVGETIRFSTTRDGHRILAMSSSRIFVISTATNIPTVEREFKVQRRPMTATLDDNGTTLAVLLADHRINVYDINGPKASRICSILPDNAPRTIALSKASSVLAVAFEGGIEIHSLIPGSLPASRVVKCDQVDSLSFSRDGTVLIGTTVHPSSTGTVILSVPSFTTEGTGDPSEQGINQIWTTQIIFPQSNRHLSHAVLLPHVIDGEIGWVFAYDESQKAFRAVRAEDPSTGYNLFAVSSSESQGTSVLPKVIPCAFEGGRLVAVALRGDQVHVYQVSENMDDSANLSSKKKFLVAREISAVQGLSAMEWVSSREKSQADVSFDIRLLVTAQGQVLSADDYDLDVPGYAEGGRILFFDFGYLIGNTEEICLELSLGDDEPELLEEEKLHHEVEVAIARRRTIAQGRSVAANPPLAANPPQPSHEKPETNGESSSQANTTHQPALQQQQHQQSDVPPIPTLFEPFEPSHTVPHTPRIEESTFEDAQEQFDTPYSHNQPRSRTTLQRAATAAATANRSRSEREPARQAVQPQIPHESDADNWVPPPPPYKPDPDEPLPEHLRLTLLPRRTEPLQRVTSLAEQPIRATTDLQHSATATTRRSRSRLGRAGASLTANLFPGRSSSQERGESRSRSPSQQLGDAVVTPRRSSDLELTANVDPVSAPSLPSAEQLASLQNRESRPRMPEHSVSDSTSLRPPRLSPSNLRQPLWSTSTVETQQSTPENGTRANSSGRRGSGYSSYSSAPDLQRPTLTRLETIHSVSSIISHLSRPQSRPRSRETRLDGFPSRSRSQTARRTWQRPPQRTVSASGSRFQEVGLGPVTSGKATKADKKASKKMKKRDRERSQSRADQGWTDMTGSGEMEADGTKKAAKCVIM